MLTKPLVLATVCLLLEMASVCGAAQEVVTFHQQPAQVGDQVGQKLAIDLDVSTTIVQSGQMANQDTATVRRRQDRLIEVIEVAGGRVRRARVSFPHSRYRSPENPDPTQLEIQAVEGKSYLVERRGEQLLVTDHQGAIPLQDEFEIVVNSVQTLGLPNPLAKFLLQRAISIGERIEVPHELAEQIMGFGDSLGEVKKFELELKELLVVDGQRCALFGATLEIRGHQDHPMEVDIEGSVTIQIDTCRTIEAKLAGPLHMTATEPSYQITAEGGLKLAIRSHYGSAK